MQHAASVVLHAQTRHGVALQAYANQLVDHHLVLDLLPALARAFFARRLPASLSFGQAAILAALGLQQRGLDDVGAALGLPANQVLALFNKARPTPRVLGSDV